MPQIPLGIGAYNRPYGKLPEIRMENRFFEQNPVGAEKVALLSRPGSSLFLNHGDGPIRTLYSQAGVFDEDLFFVSGEELFRYNEDDGVTPITGNVLGMPGYPVMTSLAIPDWEAIFITDGLTLQYYEGEGHARSMPTGGGAIANGETVVIDTENYQFTNGDVNAGTPLGTGGNPWLVALGDTDEESLENLFNAINTSGVAGTDYSLGITIHPSVRAYQFRSTSFKIRANTGGAAGNAIVTTETGANLAWTGATMAGGGGHTLQTVVSPDAISFVDLATLASHIICVEANSRRFFWLRPGEVEIDALDFSSAEAEPDHIVNVAAVGDQLWFFGQSSTEAWYASGDADQPFLRSQGRAFSQGIIPGTFAQVNETIIVIGQDRVAYRIAGVPERVSNHGIEEKIRLWQESL